MREVVMRNEGRATEGGRCPTSSVQTVPTIPLQVQRKAFSCTPH